MAIYNHITGQPSPGTRNICGQYFGFLRAIGYVGINHRKGADWLCQCDCGKWKIIPSATLTAGTTISCGCYKRTRSFAIKFLLHGESRPYKTPECGAYYQAKARCTNPRTRTWHNYGGRGIEFRFKSFEQFLKELGRKPTRAHSLDRIDVNGHYEPGNVRWATSKEQSYNKRPRSAIYAFSKTQSMAQWARELSVPYGAIHRRLSDGRWCNECAVSILPTKGVCTHSKDIL